MRRPDRLRRPSLARVALLAGALLPLLAGCRSDPPPAPEQVDAAMSTPPDLLEAPDGPPAAACSNALACAGAGHRCRCFGDGWSCQANGADGGAAAPGWLPTGVPTEGASCTAAEAWCWLSTGADRARRCRCDGDRWRCEEGPPSCPTPITNGGACSDPGTTCRAGFCWWCECTPEDAAQRWRCSTLGHVC